VHGHHLRNNAEDLVCDALPGKSGHFSCSSRKRYANGERFGVLISVTIIRVGRTVETGSLADLRHLTRYQVSASLDDGSSVSREVEPAELNDVLRELTAVGVHALTCRPPTLEEIFLKQATRRCASCTGGSTAPRSARSLPGGSGSGRHCSPHWPRSS
jgi:hypothetical protein